MKDTITITTDSLHVSQLSHINHPTYTGGWIVVGIIIFLLLVILWTRHKLQDYTNMRKQIMTGGEVDFDATINNIFLSKQIYDHLKVAYHPDRFVDPKKNMLANQIYQEITKNQHNYRRLCELQKECEEKLGV